MLMTGIPRIPHRDSPRSVTWPGIPAFQPQLSKELTVDFNDQNTTCYESNMIKSYVHYEIYIYLMKHWNSLYKDRRSLMNTMVRHITQCYGLVWQRMEALPAVYGDCRYQRLQALPALQAAAPVCASRPLRVKLQYNIPYRCTYRPKFVSILSNIYEPFCPYICEP